jgi:hypothetical protein
LFTDYRGTRLLASRNPKSTQITIPICLGELGSIGFGREVIFNRRSATHGEGPAAAKHVKTSTLRSKRLVDLSKHNYSLEPIVTFTPSGNWIVFRSNMHSPTDV